jgi:hypothetical protein
VSLGFNVKRVGWTLIGKFGYSSAFSIKLKKAVHLKGSDKWTACPVRVA